MVDQLPRELRWQDPELPRRRPGKRDTRMPYQRIHDESISEHALQKSLLEMAVRGRWLVHHETDSRKSNAGFPDLVCVHPDHGLVVIELKSERGYLAPDQYDWRDYLVAAGVRYYVFRPRDRFVADELFINGVFPEMEGYLT
ncbi:MAG: VRR-NUC domain-containing protein [Chloroflexi bacterium]|nr:VRR-NUC domain-containing protein [Chloroflexota bacterium]